MVHMDKNLDDILGIHPAFMGLSQDIRNVFSRFALQKNFQADEVMTFAGDAWPYIFLVASGNVNALKASHDGRSLVVAQLGAGEIFWGLSFFEEGLPNPVTLQFSVPSTIYMWARDDVLSILHEQGQFTWHLMNVMVKRMLHASDVIDGLAFQPVAGRLARLLLDNFDTAGERSIKRSLTLDEMAARVGTTREMVCRALYRFADQKLIDVTRTEFVLADKEGLVRLAERS